MSDQITVANSAIPEQVTSTLRAFLLALGGYMAGKGWVDGGIAAATVPMLLVGVPYVWNQWKIRRRNNDLKAVACGDKIVVRK